MRTFTGAFGKRVLITEQNSKARFGNTFEQLVTKVWIHEASMFRRNLGGNKNWPSDKLDC
jgi:hypothetical protein